MLSLPCLFYCCCCCYSLSPLSDCNLLFRFICQNIFPVPCLDKGGRKTAESWVMCMSMGMGMGTSRQRTTVATVASCSYNCCCCWAYVKVYPREICSAFCICCRISGIINIYSMPIPFTCPNFQLITTGHKWNAFCISLQLCIRYLRQRLRFKFERVGQCLDLQ